MQDGCMQVRGSGCRFGACRPTTRRLASLPIPKMVEKSRARAGAGGWSLTPAEIGSAPTVLSFIHPSIHHPTPHPPRPASTPSQSPHSLSRPAQSLSHLIIASARSFVSCETPHHDTVDARPPTYTPPPPTSAPLLESRDQHYPHIRLGGHLVTMTASN